MKIYIADIVYYMRTICQNECAQPAELLYHLPPDWN